MNLDLDSSKFLRGMDQKVRAISGWIFRFGLMNRYGSGKAFLIRYTMKNQCVLYDFFCMKCKDRQKECIRIHRLGVRTVVTSC